MLLKFGEKTMKNLIFIIFSEAIPCVKEPFAGWTDGFYGPNGIFALPLLDIVPALYWEGDTRFDCAPADFVVNALIALIQYSYNE